jgi:hypothetical protein
LPTKPVRIFHIESPGPIDVLDGNAEGPSLSAVATLTGHKVHSKVIYSRQEFETICRFLSTIGQFEDDGEKDRPLVLHISAHGPKTGDGVFFGKDFVTWEELVEVLEPVLKITKKYTGDRILVLSACYAHLHDLGTLLAKAKPRIPPRYLFSTEDVAWGDAAVGWTLFYHLLPDSTLDDRGTIKENLEKIHAALGIRIHYHRWSDEKKKYVHFAPGTAKA